MGHRDDLQLDLFEKPSAKEPVTKPALEAAPVSAETRELGAQMPPKLRLGTSSWSFPGWKGLVYESDASESVLARDGLRAYARHPLFRTVGVDRTYYAPVRADVFSSYAQSVPEAFRFLVKAQEVCTLGRFPVHPRYGTLRGQDNPHFLDAAYASDAVVAPFVEGLGVKAGPLVFQFPPQDVRALGGARVLTERLHGFLRALPRGPLYAVELRNRELYTPHMADALADGGAVPVLAAWGRLPPLIDQAKVLRAHEGAALVARWMLPPGVEYDEARTRYAPFNRLVDEDLPTRSALASLCSEALARGLPVYVTVNNKAEGSAPLSVEKLSGAILQEMARRAHEPPAVT